MKKKTSIDRLAWIQIALLVVVLYKVFKIDNHLTLLNEQLVEVLGQVGQLLNNYSEQFYAAIRSILQLFGGDPT